MLLVDFYIHDFFIDKIYKVLNSIIYYSIISSHIKGGNIFKVMATQIRVEIYHGTDKHRDMSIYTFDNYIVLFLGTHIHCQFRHDDINMDHL